jgi:hypothetical protein
MPEYTYTEPSEVVYQLGGVSNGLLVVGCCRCCGWFIDLHEREEAQSGTIS